MLNGSLEIWMQTSVDGERHLTSTSRGWPSPVSSRTPCSCQPWLTFWDTTSSSFMSTRRRSQTNCFRGLTVAEIGLALGSPARSALCLLVQNFKLFINYFVIKVITRESTTGSGTSSPWYPRGWVRPCPWSRRAEASPWRTSSLGHLKILTVSQRLYTLKFIFKILSLMDF